MVAVTRMFNDGWEFCLRPLHTAYGEMQDYANAHEDAFVPVGLPHDWLIYDAGDLYADGTGWYRRKWEWDKTDDTLVFLRFDGVYMDTRVFVNGNLAKEWKYGYSTFDVELTPFLRQGENEILVSVDYQSPNSRWYSGAGIYRNVWLRCVPQTHLTADGIYFHAIQESGDLWKIEVEAEIANAKAESGNAEMEIVNAKAESGNAEMKIVNAKAEDGNAELKIVNAKAENGNADPCGVNVTFSLLQGDREVPLQDVALSGEWAGDLYVQKMEARVASPDCWDEVSPHLYTLCAALFLEGEKVQEVRQSVGFRAISFTPDEGFLLNGRKVKFNGVCEHHDLGCLGSAFHVQAMRRKFCILREMGVNAVRTSHNMPAPELLDLADEMGILIVDEAFDMWELPKTTYDYARFFPEWYKRDVRSWVRRDRNHPCVVMWSMGNEIYDTHAGERGMDCMKRLMAEVQRHDPKGNARPTIGSNYMPWENTQKCADVIKLIGYNYAERYYDAHHAAHKDWILYGSETASVVQSRGVYHFPYAETVLSDEDRQCSALGNSTTSWGADSPEQCIVAERDHPFSCGQFLWSGFDYIGEPTPYHTKNSYFGQIDTAGFPKDAYYIYQSNWTEKPMVHLFPYWDFNEGQIIDVRACTNAPQVELFLNGKSLGMRQIDHAHGQVLTGNWQVPYEDGELAAVAYDADGNEVARQARVSFGEAARIVLRPDKARLKGDGEDLLFVEVSMEDKKGHPVENADNRVSVRVGGAGALAGTDNGDSTDTDDYKCGDRRLFNGKLLVVAKAGIGAGELVLQVSSPGLSEARLCIPVDAAVPREGSSPLAYLADASGRTLGKKDPCAQEIPVRAIRLAAQGGRALGPGHPEVLVKAELCPPNADDREVLWAVVDDKGIPLNLAQVEADGLTARVIAKGDGRFRLRCMSRCGTKDVRILSQIEFSIQGMGPAFLDPYGFVAGGLYDVSRGNVGNGNERGVATPSDEDGMFGYHGLDFGPYGSDEIRMPIFTLNDEPYRIRIYEGIAGEPGAELIGDVIYQKPSIWNVYQEETYRLSKKLKGVTDISFCTDQKFHLKGFSFLRPRRSYARLHAAECDAIYGDSFQKDGTCVRGIGNNVSLEYAGLDFGQQGAGQIRICGSTPLEKNTIMLDFVGADGQELRQTLEFVNGEQEQVFAIDPLVGKGTVRFVFLPGSHFDFAWFQFEERV